MANIYRNRIYLQPNTNNETTTKKNRFMKNQNRIFHGRDNLFLPSTKLNFHRKTAVAANKSRRINNSPGGGGRRAPFPAYILALDPKPLRPMRLR